MKLLTGFVILAVTMIAASVARGQGTPQKTVVISEPALRTMSAHKPKKKTPLTARIAVKRQSSAKISKADSAHFATASVREIPKASRK